MAIRQETLPQQAARAGTARSRRPRRTDRAGLLLTTPFFLVYFLFLLWPVLAAAWSSLFSDSLAGKNEAWLGLNNYGDLLKDSDFWSSMWHTLLFTLLSTPPLIILPLALALLVNRVARGQWLFRLAFFAPYVLPSSVVVLIWNWLYQPGYGLIDGYLAKVGLGEVNWLGQEGVAMVAVVIATVWWTFGFNFVLYLAALQDISKELYEAAATDGATGWQQIRRITLPLLMPTTILILMLQIVASLKVFDQIYLLLQGGPNFSTRPAIQYIYETGFTSYRLGYASALSFVFFLAVVLISLLLFKAVNLARRAEA